MSHVYDGTDKCKCRRAEHFVGFYGTTTPVPENTFNRCFLLSFFSKQIFSRLTRNDPHRGAYVTWNFHEHPTRSLTAVMQGEGEKRDATTKRTACRDPVVARFPRTNVCTSDTRVLENERPALALLCSHFANRNNCRESSSLFLLFLFLHGYVIHYPDTKTESPLYVRATAMGSSFRTWKYLRFVRCSGSS